MLLGWSLTPATFARVKAFHGVLHSLLSTCARHCTWCALLLHTPTFEARARLADSSQPPPRTQTSLGRSARKQKGIFHQAELLPARRVRAEPGARPCGPKQAAQPARAFGAQEADKACLSSSCCGTVLRGACESAGPGNHPRSRPSELPSAHSTDSWEQGAQRQNVPVLQAIQHVLVAVIARIAADRVNVPGRGNLSLHSGNLWPKLDPAAFMPEPRKPRPHSEASQRQGCPDPQNINCSGKQKQKVWPLQSWTILPLGGRQGMTEEYTDQHFLGLRMLSADRAFVAAVRSTSTLRKACTRSSFRDRGR